MTGPKNTTIIIPFVFSLLNQFPKNVIFGTIIAFAISRICQEIIKQKIDADACSL
jgi:hypothetical protein